jgi:hypothetical protein
MGWGKLVTERAIDQRPFSVVVLGE